MLFCRSAAWGLSSGTLEVQMFFVGLFCALGGNPPGIESTRACFTKSKTHFLRPSAIRPLKPDPVDRVESSRVELDIFCRNIGTGLHSGVPPSFSRDHIILGIFRGLLDVHAKTNGSARAVHTTRSFQTQVPLSSRVLLCGGGLAPCLGCLSRSFLLPF